MVIWNTDVSSTSIYYVVELNKLRFLNAVLKWSIFIATRFFCPSIYKLGYITNISLNLLISCRETRVVISSIFFADHKVLDRQKL